jgi:hypothetical protein
MGFGGDELGDMGMGGDELEDMGAWEEGQWETGRGSKGKEGLETLTWDERSWRP